MTADWRVPTLLYTWIGVSEQHSLVLTVARLPKPDSYALILRTAPPAGSLSTLRSTVRLHFDQLWSTPLTSHTRSVVYVHAQPGCRAAEDIREFMRRAFPVHFPRLRWLACSGGLPDTLRPKPSKAPQLQQSASQYNRQAKVAYAFPAEQRDEELAMLLWCVKQLKDE